MAVLDTVKYLDAVCRMVEEGGTHVPVPIRGNSMRPFMRNGDFAYLEAIRRPVKKGDIVLFQRRDGSYILHRIYKIRPSGEYWMLGDSQTAPEPVAPEQLRAIATAARCGAQLLTSKNFRWWFFAHPWRWAAPWRDKISRIREIFRR